MDKKNYSVCKNIFFTHKYIIQEYKFKYWIGSLIVVLASISTIFMLTLLPAYAVKYAIAYFVVFNKVKNGLEISQFIMVTGLILGVNNWITSIFDNIKYLQLNNITVNNSRTAIEIDDDKSVRSMINQSGILDNKLPVERTHELRFENVSFIFQEGKIKIFDKFNSTMQLQA